MSREAITPPDLHPATVYRTSWRASWADAWTVLADAEPRSIRLHALPRVSEADVAVRYGRLLQPGAAVWATRAAGTLRGAWLKIETLNADTQAVEQLLFVGRVASEAWASGAAWQGVRRGLWTLRAVGLEAELLRPRVDRALTRLGRSIFDTEAGWIDRPLVFNERLAVGLGRSGNASTLPYTDPVTGRTARIFENAGSTGEPTLWTVRQIVDYLLAFLTPAPVAAGGVAPAFALGGQLDLIDALEPPRLDPAGRQVLEVIGMALDPRRGVVCVPAYSDTGLTLTVRSQLATPLTIGAKTLPASDQQLSLDLDADPHLADTPQISEDDVSRYDRVVVRGEPVVTCFTVSVGAGSLEPVWTEAERAAYDAADDAGRVRDELAHVYTTFRLPPTLDLSPLSPAVDAAGEIDPANDAPIRRWGRTLLRQLPLVKGWIDTEPEYREPLVLIELPASPGTYAPVDRLDGAELTPCGVRMLDTEPGFALLMRPAHRLALDTFTGDSDDAPEVDYQTLLATVAMQTDALLTVTVDLSDPMPAEPPLGDLRVLTIDVPDAHLWWIKDQTVLDVDDTGQLLLQPGNAVIRTDADRLAAIAQLAAAWYRTPRRSLTAVRRGVRCTQAAGGFPLGSLITATTSGGGLLAVNTVVTTLHLDLVGNRTTLVTSYQDLDPRDV